MADREEDVEIETAQDKDRQKREATKAMDTLTDNAPEERQLDADKVKKAMESLAAAQKQTKDAQLQKERELAAVKINKEDVDVIATEFEIDKKVAERRLRECGGDLVKALESFL